MSPIRQESTQMQTEPICWNMYALHNGQISNDSVSSQDTKYTTLPLYELPQSKYYPAKRKTFTRYMSPIIFQDIDLDIPGIPLKSLKEDLSLLQPNIVGGMDRVFRRYPNMENINLRIMWPGYTPRYGTQTAIQFSIDTTRTTRAMIAQIVGQKVAQFMARVSETPSTQKLYSMGPDGIQISQVLLAAIENSYDNTWQARLYIMQS